MGKRRKVRWVWMVDVGVWACGCVWLSGAEGLITVVCTTVLLSYYYCTDYCSDRTDCTDCMGDGRWEGENWTGFEVVGCTP